MGERVADDIQDAAPGTLPKFRRLPGGFRNQVDHLDCESGFTVICENPEIAAILLTVFGHYLKNRILPVQIFALNCPYPFIFFLNNHHHAGANQLLRHGNQRVHFADTFRSERKIERFQGGGNRFQRTASVKFLGRHLRKFAAICLFKCQFVICQIIQGYLSPSLSPGIRCSGTGANSVLQLRP